MNPNKNFFEDDERFTEQISGIIPEAFKTGRREFVNLAPEVSMFKILPMLNGKGERINKFYYNTVIHHGLKELRTDGTTANTARICPEAMSIGKCAACFAYRKLLGSKVPADVNMRRNIRPQRKVYLTIWWIPLQREIINSNKTLFKVLDFEGRWANYSINAEPFSALLGLSDKMWESVKMLMLENGGVELFFNPEDYAGEKPIYIVGNGQVGRARRYKEPKVWNGVFPPELNPPNDVKLLDVESLLEIPTAEDMALVVDETFPGILEGFEI